MNLFELAAKITLDTKDYTRSVKDAIESVKEISNKFKELKEKAQSVHDTIHKVTTPIRNIGSVTVSAVGTVSKGGAAAVAEFAKVTAKVGEGLVTVTEGTIKGIGKAAKMVSSTVADVVKVTTAAIAATGAAVGKVVKDSVAQYAEYEQLAGGVQKLFGDNADDVVKYARDAYKTSGLSANDYMQQATSFSAALINSLGGDTAEAARLTDLAMRSMSDNFNTFGTDMESVQNAYQSFAKQQYNLLDNLKLGYSGTKAGMQQLIADANEYAKANGLAADLSIDSYGDIIKAIDLIQQKQHIAGTTAKEAATTIEGAVGMTKAAWQNLITGLSDQNADLRSLVNDLVSSAATTVKNIAPVVVTAIKSIAAALPTLVPAVMDVVSSVATEIVPQVISSAGDLLSRIVDTFADSDVGETLLSIADELVKAFDKVFGSIGKAFRKVLPNLVKSLSEFARRNSSKILSVLNELITNIFLGIAESAPALLNGVLDQIVYAITNFFSDTSTLKTIIEAGKTVADALLMGLIVSLPMLTSTAVTMLKTMAETLTDPLYLDGLVTAAVTILTYLGQFFTDSLSVLVPAIVSIITTVATSLTDPENLNRLVDGAVAIITSLAKLMMDSLELLIPAIVDIIISIADTLSEPHNLEMLIDGAIAILTSLAKMIVDNLPRLIRAAVEIIKKITDVLIKPENLKKIVDGAIAIIEAVAGFIVEALPILIPAAIQIITSIVNELIKPENLKKLVEATLEIILAIAGALLDPENLKNIIKSAKEILKSIVQTLIDEAPAVDEAVSEIIDKIGEFFSSGWEDIKKIGSDIFDGIEEGFSDVVSGALDWGSDLIHNFADGIKGAWNSVKDAIGGIGQWIKDNIGFSEPDEGPLKDFHTYSPDMIALFTKGIRDNEGMLHKQIAKTFDLRAVLEDAYGDLGDLGSITSSVSVSNDNAMNRTSVAQIAQLLTQYLPQLAQMTVQLDSGALVGELAPGMDVALGSRQSYALRGVAV